MYPHGCADDFRGQVAGFDVRTPRRKTLTTKLAKHIAKDLKEDVTNEPKRLSLVSRGAWRLLCVKTSRGSAHNQSFVRSLEDQTGRISYRKCHHGPNSHIPCPRNRSAQPDVEFYGEAAQHAQHRAVLVRTAGQSTHYERTPKLAVTHRRNLQSP